MSLDRTLRTAVSLTLERREAWDELDAVAGDGDFGSTVARGCAALAAAPPPDARSAGLAFARASGGSSGALIGAALLAVEDAGDPVAAVRAMDEAIADLGGAELGDGTLRDALHAAGEALADGVDAAATAAREAADETAAGAARRGRAAYAGERSEGAADPGAEAVAELFEALRSGDEPPSWDELAERAGDPEDSAADDLVDRAVDGLVRAHPGLRRLEEERVVVRAEPVEGVAVVSGGGAGHEPLHAGFVGPGMLAAACPGAVFTSPATDQAVAAARAVDAGAGVLFVVKNYTGDVLNFRLAARELDGEVETATVLVADDTATEAGAGPGRRGTGATIAVEKLTGALAAEGRALEDCRALGQAVADDARSFGIAFHDDEMEPGVGIHGEPGREREPLAEGRDLARALLEPVLAEVDGDRPQLVLLSGLGGTAPLHLQALFADVTAELDERGVSVERSLVGDLITSLDQAGAVLTLVPLDDRRLELWDAPVRTPALWWDNG